jgi:hypothetical protein
VAWLLCFPSGNTVSGFERTDADAHTRIWIWCRRCDVARVTVFPHHPEKEVSHAAR